MRKILIFVLFFSLGCALFDEEFQNLKDRLASLEQQVEEDRTAKQLLRSEVSDLRVKVSRFTDPNNDPSLNEVKMIGKYIIYKLDYDFNFLGASGCIEQTWHSNEWPKL